MVMLRAYKDLCTAPAGASPWPALNGGPDAPGPFERGWRRFWQQQRPLVLEAQRKTLAQPGNAESWTYPSLWNTQEMEEELEQARESYVGEEDAHELDEPGQVGASARLSLLQKVAPGRRGRLSNSWPFEPARGELLSVAEYNALQTLSIARNYDGIAHAQAEKPKRQIDRDAKTTEQPLYVEGADGTSWGGEGQIGRLGDDKTAALRPTVHLAHHFDRADLDDILAYKTAERTPAFMEELQ